MRYIIFSLVFFCLDFVLGCSLFEGVAFHVELACWNRTGFVPFRMLIRANVIVIAREIRMGNPCWKYTMMGTSKRGFVCENGCSEIWSIYGIVNMCRDLKTVMEKAICLVLWSLWSMSEQGYYCGHASWILSRSSEDYLIDEWDWRELKQRNKKLKFPWEMRKLSPEEKQVKSRSSIVKNPTIIKIEKLVRPNIEILYAFS